MFGTRTSFAMDLAESKLMRIDRTGLIGCASFQFSIVIVSLNLEWFSEHAAPSAVQKP